VCIEVDMEGAARGNVSATLTAGNWRFSNGGVSVSFCWARQGMTWLYERVKDIVISQDEG
jgi:hypothetical protein